MKKFERVLLFLKEHLSMLQILMVLLVVVLGAISGVSENATPLIIALLLFIGAEQYLNLTLYSKQFLKDTSEIKRNSVELLEGVSDIRGNSENTLNLTFMKNASAFIFEERIKMAKHSIFISGGTLESMLPYRAFLSSIPKETTVEIAYTNFENGALLSAFKKMIGFGLPDDSLKRLYQQGQEFCEYMKTHRPTTIIYKVDYLMPIAYAAIDICDIECNTFIRAKHYLNNSNDDTERLIYIARYDSEIFQLYRRQINEIKANASLCN